MKRRIYISMLALAVISVIFVSVTLCAVFYNQFSYTVQNDVRECADALTELVSGRNAEWLGPQPELRVGSEPLHVPPVRLGVVLSQAR